MKKLLSLMMILTTFNVYAMDVADSSSDKVPYIKTPLAKQSADLSDDDDDGVINARDLCPGTPEGAEIDNDGCGTFYKSKETKELHILFSNNSSEINPLFLGQVRQMAEFMRQYPATKIELKGYASKTGNTEDNLLLSQQRAEAVQRQLIADGLSGTRIKIVGFGDADPEMVGDSDLVHARNRRVTATVVGYHGDVKKAWTIFTTLPKNSTRY